MSCLIDNKILAGWHWNLAFKFNKSVGVFLPVANFCNPTMLCDNQDVDLQHTLNEPRSEKTGFRGFRPGPTQTGL